MPDLPLARLHVMYVYDCDNCGRENLVRPVVCEMSEEEEEALRAETGVDSSELGDWCMMPVEVECPHCKARYTVYDERNG